MNLNNTAADRWTTPFNPTPGAVNALPGFNRVGGVASGDLEGTNLYVRNSADLDSVAELGFIHAGAPWTTITLFDERGRQLLMRYRTTNLTARYTDAFAGSINPNTLFTNVLIAAFINTPINDSPSGTVVRTVDEFMARDIVGGIFAANRAGPAREGASGWMTTTAFAVNGRLMQAPYNLDNTRKESIIRNTYRLFNANQNLFVFVVVAQTINDQRTLGSWEPNYDQITSEKRAVAIVWRDPFPVVGSNPLRHQMFVRTFKFLDE